MTESPRVQSHTTAFSLSVSLSVVIMILLGCLTYANTLGHPFVHDDVAFIVRNSSIARWDNIGEAFWAPAIPRSPDGIVTPYYRPLLEVSYRLQYALFGSNAAGFHAVNIALHIANGLWLLALLRALGQRGKEAFWIALVFIVHPVQTQAVACVSGISNVLCAFFILASFYLYVMSRTKARGILWLGWSLLFFTAALLTKEQALFAVIMFAAYEWFWPSNERFGALLRLTAFGLLAAGYLLVRHLLFGSLTGAVFDNPGELKLRLLSIPRLVETLTGLIIFPSGLHYYRSIDILAPHGWPVVVFAMIVALTVLITKRMPSEHRRHACFGLIWFFTFFLPVLNILPLINEYSFIAASEHGLYLPLAGFLIFGTAVVTHEAQRRPAFFGRSASLVLGVIIAISCVLSIRQNTFWRSEVALFERAVQFEPQLGRVHVLLAKAYMSDGRFAEARREFGKAQAIMAEYSRKATSEPARRFYQGFLKGIYTDTAPCELALGRPQEAVEEYTKAITLDPKDDRLYTGRALILLQTGRLADGIGDLQTAHEINPRNLETANNLSIAYIQNQEPQRAQQLLEWILRQNPSFSPAKTNLETLKRSLAGR